MPEIAVEKVVGSIAECSIDNVRGEVDVMNVAIEGRGEAKVTIGFGGVAAEIAGEGGDSGAQVASTYLASPNGSPVRSLG